MKRSVTLPPFVGAFFIRWFKRLPEIPENFDLEWGVACCFHFNFFPNPFPVKNFYNIIFPGQLVFFFFQMFTDSHVVTLVFWALTVLCFITVFLFFFVIRRAKEFSTWMLAIAKHKDFKPTMDHLEKNKEKYAEMNDDHRRAYDIMKMFVTDYMRCTEINANLTGR